MRKISLGTLNINQKGRDYVQDILDNNRLSRGPYMEKFEKKFARMHEVKHALFMNSGTSALQVALAALKELHGYRDGDEVLVPATTFIATSNIVIQNNLKPVFVDVDPITFNISPEKIVEKITPRTRCIIPVHLFGLPANMYRITAIARNYDLQVIEDSCETMLAEQYDQSVGSYGDLACFSTYVAHLVVGGVGGIVTTDSDKLYDLCVSLMNHGRNTVYTNIDDDDKPENLRTIMERRYQFERVGYSYRATEFEAAIALSELEVAEVNIHIRRANAAFLTRLLEDLPQLQLPMIPNGMTHSFMMYPMVLADRYDRDDFLIYLEERGIETRYLFPLLTQPVYQKLFPELQGKYPVADRLAKQGFFIGMHQGLNLLDIEYVSKVIHKYFKDSR